MTEQVLEGQPLPPAGKRQALCRAVGGVAQAPQKGQQQPLLYLLPAEPRLSEAPIDDTCQWSWCQGPGALLGWFC